MTSAVQIANLALFNIGARSTIESLTENSVEAQSVNLVYERARLEVLEAMDWAFARKRLTLATHGTAPPDEWGYRYQYPSDCVSARRIENPSGIAADAIPFEIETTGDEKTILTDQDEAVLVYTRDVTVTRLYSSHFISAFAARIAWWIAQSRTGRKDVRDDMARLYNILILTAGSVDSNERVGKPPREAEWIRGR